MLEYANITNFNNHNGLYYESKGQVKISHADWDLITYLDLNTYSSTYVTLATFYNITMDICTEIIQKLNNTDVPHSCTQFSQATLPYFFEIQTNYNNIFLAINQNQTIKDRVRRGLGENVSRLANVLYGFCSNLNI